MGRANLNHKGYSLDINEKDEIVVGENLKNNGKLVCGVQQFKKNGIPDSAFGINSFSSITIDNDPMLETESKIKFDKKGNIVIGSTWNRPVGSSLYPYLIVSRFKANGAIDSGFNNTGILVLYKIKSAHLLTALAIQNDNKIVVGAQSGGSLHPEGNFLVVRINENGIVDSSFNKKGFVITDFNYNPNVNPKKYDILSSLIIQPDNKIIAAGSSLQYYGNGGQFALCRYERNGSLDTSFGFRGRVTTKFNFGYEAGCTDAILQQDGKIVLAGYSDTNIDLHSYSNFAIARYNKEKSNAQLFIIENATVKETGTLISVYPVPTSDRLFLTGLHPNDNYIINISSISGEIVFLTKVNQISSYSISVRYLHSGQYFLNIISEQKTISKEFIKH
jgi:uncharacterized delta-60 repeat protein